jgi:hypothetical protein
VAFVVAGVEVIEMVASAPADLVPATLPLQAVRQQPEEQAQVLFREHYLMR